MNSNDTSTHRPDLFVHTLNSLRTGAAKDMSAELAAAVDAARTTQKMATVTLVLKIKPEPGMDGVYKIEDEIKSNLPKMPRGSSIMFGTPDGNLVDQDPNQQKLELRSVAEDTPAPLRKVGS